MELAALAATSGGTAAAATGAGAAMTAMPAVLPSLSGAGAAGAFSNIFTLSSLSTGMTLASMAGDIFGGRAAGDAAARQLQQQAEQDFFNAKREELKGKQEANDITENLLQTIDTQRLAYASAGMDFSFGTPRQLERNLKRRADMQFSTSRDNTRLKTLARRRQGHIRLSQVSQEQNAPVLGGLMSAGTKLAGVLK